MNRVASWIGYCEHKSPKFLGIPNANVGKGYTIFADIVGLPQKIPWCTTFVFAVHPQASLLGEPCSGTRTLKKRMKRARLYRGKEYTPKPGDIIFLSNTRTKLVDHCGIVESCDGLFVTSIEGNARDDQGRFRPDEGGVVARRTRAMDDTLIVGYAEID